MRLRSASGEDPLDSDLPLGDGAADTEADVACPHCGEPASIALDPSGGAKQDYVEDCPVCCRPWRVNVTYRRDGSAHVSLDLLDD